MADSGERRMLFDVRGRRKNVLRIIYALLALLMGTSLFFVVGPFNLAEVVGGGATSNAAEVLDEQAERIEQRLAKDPTDEAQLLALTRTRIAAGNAQLETNPETGAQVVTEQARVEFQQALGAWNRYLRQAGEEANPAAAQLVAGTYFNLAENSGTLGEIESNLEQAASAQRIAAEDRPNLGSLSTLAIYEYFSGDFAAGDRATGQAAGRAPSNAEAKAIERQLADYRKRGKRFEKQKRRFAKIERERGEEALQNPLGGLAGGSGETLAP